MAKIFPFWKDGDVLEPRHLNWIFGELQRWRRIRAAAPIVIRNTEADEPPNIEFWGQDLTAVCEAIVTTPITACSGLVYGYGQAQIYIDDGNGNAIVDNTYPEPVTVLNFLQNSGTIGMNKHVYIAQRNGGWRLISGDC